MSFLRCVVFYAGYYLLIILWALSMLLIALWFPVRRRTVFCSFFYILYENWLRLCLNIRVRYEYESTLPAIGNYIIVANHQTEWEAFALASLRRPTTVVLKEELMRIPLFGWATATLDPIFIQRKNLVESMRRIYIQGGKKLKQGYNLLVFPQGTRVPPPQTGRWNPSAVRMALATQTPLLFIAHNSGEHIPRGFSARAGTIRVRVSAPVNPQGWTRENLYREMTVRMGKMMKEVHEKR